ncbi:MAG TPA: hypothetical protein VF446_05380 [Trinickia sp.]
MKGRLTFAARAFLESTLDSASEGIVGETPADLTVDGWTGVGFVLNIAAAGVQLLANQVSAFEILLQNDIGPSGFKPGAQAHS